MRYTDGGSAGAISRANADERADEKMDSLNLATEAVKVPRTMNPETIYVAPLSLVEVTVADARVSHLVTLINGDTPIPTPRL